MDTNMQAEAGPSSARHDALDGEDAAWRKTKTGQRILELKDVDQDIASLLHLAGCTIASLHPDPLSSFTTKVVSFEEEDEDEGIAETKEKPIAGDAADKATQFSQYAEAYYSTLNDIQLALRTSIRRLRLARATSAPLLDPFFGDLGTPSGGRVGPGGVAMDAHLKPLHDSPSPGQEGQLGEAAAAVTTPEARVSVAALQLEREAWETLAAALGVAETAVK